MRGYEEPICQPLTKRPLIFGLPVIALGLAVIATQQMIFEQLWFLGPIILLVIYVLRRLYAHDPWGVGGLVDHIIMTQNNRTFLQG